MKYPDKETYRKLYARYVADQGRPVADLMDLASTLRGKTVVDLCGGAGEISVEAVKRGAARTLLVDQSVDMMGESTKGVEYWRCPVEEFLETFHKEVVDVVFCRQAVNYWFNKDMAEMLAGCLAPGGEFIFNTFSKKPDWKPKVKEYEFNGHFFVETSWRVGDVVHHVQCRDGMEPHTTQFKWIDTQTFYTWLHPYFDIDRNTDGATHLYCCKKKQL